jgi:hypothetical protein
LLTDLLLHIVKKLERDSGFDSILSSDREAVKLQMLIKLISEDKDSLAVSA